MEIERIQETTDLFFKKTMFLFFCSGVFVFCFCFLLLFSFPFFFFSLFFNLFFLWNAFVCEKMRAEKRGRCYINSFLFEIFLNFFHFADGNIFSIFFFSFDRISHSFTFCVSVVYIFFFFH